MVTDEDETAPVTAADTMEKCQVGNLTDWELHPSPGKRGINSEIEHFERSGVFWGFPVSRWTSRWRIVTQPPWKSGMC